MDNLENQVCSNCQSEINLKVGKVYYLREIEKDQQNGLVTQHYWFCCNACLEYFIDT